MLVEKDDVFFSTKWVSLSFLSDYKEEEKAEKQIEKIRHSISFSKKNHELFSQLAEIVDKCLADTVLQFFLSVI